MTDATEDRQMQAGWVTVSILTVCYATSIADRLIVNLLVDPIKSDLALTDLQMSLVLGPAFAITYALFSLPLGRLADLTNRRNLIAASMIVWSICTMACGFARNFVTLVVARVGVGTGEAGLSPAAYGILADRFTPSRLGRAMGFYLLGGAIGNAAAFFAGGALYATFLASDRPTLPIIGALSPWQLTLISLGTFGLLMALIVRLFLREPERNAARTRLPIGAVVAHALRPAFVWLFASYALLSIVVYGYLGWLPSYLARAFGLSVPAVGQYVGVIVLIGGLLAPLPAGWVADRWRGERTAGPMRLVALLGMPLAASSLLTFQATALPWALAGCLVVGLATTAMLTLVPLTIQLLSGTDMRGHMTGIALMVGNVIGQCFGPTSIALLSSPIFGVPMGAAMGGVFSVAALACSAVALCAYRASAPRAEVASVRSPT